MLVCTMEHWKLPVAFCQLPVSNRTVSLHRLTDTDFKSQLIALKLSQLNGLRCNFDLMVAQVIAHKRYEIIVLHRDSNHVLKKDF